MQDLLEQLKGLRQTAQLVSAYPEQTLGIFNDSLVPQQTEILEHSLADLEAAATPETADRYRLILNSIITPIGIILDMLERQQPNLNDTGRTNLRTLQDWHNKMALTHARLALK